MDIRTRLITTAERLFDRNGYGATGMDTLTRDAGLSSRTVYKHAGSKADLMAAVLCERDRRFMEQLQARTVEALFDGLSDWIGAEGARGCLFLRALGETGGDTPVIAAAVRAHKERMRERVAGIVAAQTGREDEGLAEQVLVLFEGATAAAAYRGVAAVTAARDAATVLVARPRP